MKIKNSSAEASSKEPESDSFLMVLNLKGEGTPIKVALEKKMEIRKLEETLSVFSSDALKRVVVAEDKLSLRVLSIEDGKLLKEFPTVPYEI